MKHIDGLRKEIRVLKDRNAYLQDDNCQLIRTLNALQKKYDDLQGEYNLLEEENKGLHIELADAYRANGQLKRKYEGKCAGTVKTDTSIFTQKPLCHNVTSPLSGATSAVKAGESNA